MFLFLSGYPEPTGGTVDWFPPIQKINFAIRLRAENCTPGAVGPRLPASDFYQRGLMADGGAVTPLYIQPAL